MGSIVVSGSTGFVGSHLARRLLLSDQKVGKRVVSIDNSHTKANGHISSLNGVFPDPKYFALYKEDIKHKDAISDILRNERPIDVFIHLVQGEMFMIQK